MFSFGRKQAVSATVAVAEPVQVLAVPTPQKVSGVELGGVALAEYEEVAKAIGFNNPALLQAQLLNFFAENGIPVFPKDKVIDYLDELAKKETKKARQDRVWCWKPLLGTSIGKLRASHTNRNGQISGSQYQREVPLPVLLTVQKIAAQFPEHVHFYVSDIEAPNPDPFLAVMADGVIVFIIERWDEPTFRT